MLFLFGFEYYFCIYGRYNELYVVFIYGYKLICCILEIIVNFGFIFVNNFFFRVIFFNIVIVQYDVRILMYIILLGGGDNFFMGNFQGSRYEF